MPDIENGAEDASDKKKHKKYVLDTIRKQKMKEEALDEVAPPGAKAERMVKHIKKSYAKDGKLTDKEKSIAYATSWKHKNKDK